MSITTDSTELKRQAGERAVDFVQPGMVVGLGHGSTAIWAVRRVAALYTQGALPDIVCVPCSRAVEDEARALGLPLSTLDDHPRIDVTIDGADEVDSQLDLIKGGGGALLREKMVAQASAREIIVVSDAKLVDMLGAGFALPVEVVTFSWRATMRWLQRLEAAATLRTVAGGAPFHTDQGNLIIDCAFGPLADPYALAARLESRAGVVEHGLFLGLATDVIVAGAKGLQHLTRK